MASPWSTGGVATALQAGQHSLLANGLARDHVWATRRVSKLPYTRPNPYKNLNWFGPAKTRIYLRTVGNFLLVFYPPGDGPAVMLPAGALPLIKI